jgi:cyclase
VQVKYLGRGNTAGDAIVYLPIEKILVAGDLLVHPIPYTYDGYPAEWAQTLQRMAQLDASTIVPGHGPVLHDKAYLSLVMDLLQSAVDQVRARIRQLGFPGSHSVNDIKGSVDLTSFRTKFAGDDIDLQAEFDDMTEHLVKITFSEAAQR